MTPREQSTLETILRHVGAFNHRVVDGARLGHIVILGKQGAMQTGDVVIESVTFRPTGARCA